MKTYIFMLSGFKVKKLPKICLSWKFSRRLRHRYFPKNYKPSCSALTNLTKFWKPLEKNFLRFFGGTVPLINTLTSFSVLRQIENKNLYDLVINANEEVKNLMNTPVNYLYWFLSACWHKTTTNQWREAPYMYCTQNRTHLGETSYIMYIPTASNSN